VTRDLQELYWNAARFFYGFPDQWPDVNAALRRSFQRIYNVSSLLHDHIERGSSHVAIAIVQQVSTTEQRGNLFAKILGGVALFISLAQAPGTLHDLPEDIANLGSDVATVSRTIGAGLVELGESVTRALDRPPPRLF
jgi:hypothetical protein